MVVAAKQWQDHVLYHWPTDLTFDVPWSTTQCLHNIIKVENNFWKQQAAFDNNNVISVMIILRTKKREDNIFNHFHAHKD